MKPRFAMLLLAAFCVRTAPAADSYWQEAGGGDFNNAANWDPGVPGSDDSAFFNVVSTYQVDFQTGVTNAHAHILAGTITFDLASLSWKMDSLDVVWSDGTVARAVFKNGTLTVGSGRVAQLENREGELVISGPDAYFHYTGADTFWVGGATAHGVLRIEDGARAVFDDRIDMGGGSSARGEFVITGPGTTADVTGANALYYNRGTNTVLVSDGATLFLHGNNLANRAYNEIIIDNAHLNHDTGSFFLPYDRRSRDSMIMRNGATFTNTSSTAISVGYSYGGSTGTGAITIESGSRLVKQNALFNVAFQSDATLIVRDPGTELLVEDSSLRLSYGSSYVVTGIVQVHTGALVRVADNIRAGYYDVNTAMFDVIGSQARVEVGDSFYVGVLAAAATTLTVADEGRLAVTNLIDVGSLSTLAVNGGTIESGDLALRKNDGNRSRLKVTLCAGGTNALITVGDSAIIDDADFELALSDGFESDPGEKFTIMTAGTLTGEFNGIMENHLISAGDYYQFRVSYENNSFTLSTMPPKGIVITLF